MRIEVAVSCLVLATLCTAVAATEVAVVVEGVKPGEGDVRVGVYTRNEAFDGEPVVGHTLSGDSPKTELSITGLEPGLYAVAAYQDQSGSESLERNAFGVPREPFGFSHGARGWMGPPDFDEAAFEVGEESLRITVPLE